MKTLFISKDEGEVVKYVDDFRALGYTTCCASFLEFQAVYRPIQGSFDVLFFSSPRSVIFYLGQHPVPSNVRLACSGARTADILRAAGYQTTFVGSSSGDMGAVAQEFKQWCGTDRVLFPLSDRTLGTVSAVFDPEQIELLPVYQTIVRERSIPESEVYVFTSPSNVEGFFLSNALVSGAKVIAWGKSTAAALAERNIVSQALEHASMEELLKILA